MALSKFKPASFDLTDNYAFTGTTTGLVDTNQLVLIKTLTASSSGTLSFVNGASSVVLDATYKTYLFKFINLHPSAGSYLLFNGSLDTGSNYNVVKTSTHFQTRHDEDDTDTQLSYETGKDLAQGTGFQWLVPYVGNGNDECMTGDLWLFNPSSTTFVKHFTSQTNGYGEAGTYGGFAAGYFNTTSAIDAIQFKMNSGNIDSGTIKLYGIL